MASTSGENFLEPLADKIAQSVVECYRGEAFGPLSPIARRNGDQQRAARLQVEEASLLLLACKHSAHRALLMHHTDTHQAMMSLAVLDSIVKEKIERVTSDLEEGAVEHAYFDGNFPNGVFHSDAVAARLPESEPLSISVPILIDWTRFMSEQSLAVASAALNPKTPVGTALSSKVERKGCLLPILLGVSVFGAACSIVVSR